MLKRCTLLNHSLPLVNPIAKQSINDQCLHRREPSSNGYTGLRIMGVNCIKSRDRVTREQRNQNSADDQDPIGTFGVLGSPSLG